MSFQKQNPDYFSIASLKNCAFTFPSIRKYVRGVLLEKRLDQNGNEKEVGRRDIWFQKFNVRKYPS